MIDGWEDITAAADGADQGATSLALLRMFDSAPNRSSNRSVRSGIALRHHSVATRATHLHDLDDDGPEPVPGAEPATTATSSRSSNLPTDRRGAGRPAGAVSW